jgi:hypothetical protein
VHLRPPVTMLQGRADPPAPRLPPPHTHAAAARTSASRATRAPPAFSARRVSWRRRRRRRRRAAAGPAFWKVCWQRSEPLTRAHLPCAQTCRPSATKWNASTSNLPAAPAAAATLRARRRLAAHARANPAAARAGGGGAAQASTEQALATFRGPALTSVTAAAPTRTLVNGPSSENKAVVPPAKPQQGPAAAPAASGASAARPALSHTPGVVSTLTVRPELECALGLWPGLPAASGGLDGGAANNPGATPLPAAGLSQQTRRGPLPAPSGDRQEAPLTSARCRSRSTHCTQYGCSAARQGLGLAAAARRSSRTPTMAGVVQRTCHGESASRARPPLPPPPTAPLKPLCLQRHPQTLCRKARHQPASQGAQPSLAP